MTVEIINNFKEKEVTHSTVHYLSAIDQLHQLYGYARSIDIARKLNITRGSASLMLKHLKVKGFIQEDKNRFILLTELGVKSITEINNKRKIFESFLVSVLNIPIEIAAKDACKVEHLLSSETGHTLLCFLKYINSQKNNTKELITKFKENHINCPKHNDCIQYGTQAKCMLLLSNKDK